MIRLDHLAIPVRDRARARDWYTAHFGFTVELEIPATKTVGLRDDADLTVFVFEPDDGAVAPSCILTLQVDDVVAKHRELAGKGIAFEKAPQRLFWGFGAELRDPDGYLLRLWDVRSMREWGSG